MSSIPKRSKLNRNEFINNSGITLISAYQIWLDQGNAGTQADFLASLKGADGINGVDGTNGAPGPAGPQGPQGAPGIAALVEDNVEVAKGDLTNIGREWKIINIGGAPSQGVLSRINILSNKTLATKYDIFIGSSNAYGTIDTLLEYKNVPANGFRLDSGEAIPYKSSLYLGIKFNDEVTNSIEYKIDIRTQGEMSITTTTSKYRTTPPLAADMKLASYMPLAHDLGSQVDGNNNSFALNPPAVIDSIMLMENGLVLRQDTGTETGDYSITNDSLITMNYSPLLGNSLVAMYIEK